MSGMSNKTLIVLLDGEIRTLAKIIKAMRDALNRKDAEEASRLIPDVIRMAEVALYHLSRSDDIDGAWLAFSSIPAPDWTAALKPRYDAKEKPDA